MNSFVLERKEAVAAKTRLGSAVLFIEDSMHAIVWQLVFSFCTEISSRLAPKG